MSSFHKRSSHHRHRDDSDEPDVFEAVSSFSGYREPYGGYDSAAYTPKIMREEREAYFRRKRMSLDVPVRDLKMETLKKERKPSTPGGKLASFLNSLLNQTPLKKKKSQSKDVEEDIPSGRTRRRSSICQFLGINKSDSESIYPSSTSGFRTPPPYSITKGHNFKDSGSHADHKQAVVFSKHGTGNFNGIVDDKRELDWAWFDEKLRVLNNGHSEKCKIIGGNGKKVEKDALRFEKFALEEKKDVIRNFNEELDEGAESDSSSDLFELKTYDLGCYSRCGAVYDSNHVDSIQRRPPINSNGPL